MATRASGGARPRRPNAVTLLTQDHREVKKLFREFQKLTKKKDEADPEQKRELVQQACRALTVHARLEEELFYPAVRDAIDDDDTMDEAEVEHTAAKQLIAELQSAQPGDPLYDAKFTVLGEYVNHHVEEEEKQMFPKVKKSDLDLLELGETMMTRRGELEQDPGLLHRGAQRGAQRRRAA